MHASFTPFPTRAASAVILLLLAALAAWAYWPGLHGGFLFDDFANLPALGRYGGVRDLASLSWYLTSGIADPTGRPVSMLSFLIDARDWPAAPFPFKRTNLLIHLCNGMLLYSVLAALGRRHSDEDSHVRGAALLATAIWLLHPLWSSTVLYVIQRHAMLAALFVLAGIRSWIASRDAFDAGNTCRGWGLAVLALPVFGVLAGLSKANGFLLPVLLAVLQVTVLRRSSASATTTADRHAALASTTLVWLPALMLLGWMTQRGIQTAFADSNFRPWSLGQRLLTQPRALCDYLWQLLAPGLDATGVFADAFPVSRSWREPWTTLPALGLLSILAALGWAARRRWPIFSAALLFFLAGHLLESSVIMLELYFEHRNYLPATLLFWPLAWWLVRPVRYRRWQLSAGVGFLAICLLATAAQARTWASPLMLALTWADQHPHSARAQAYAASQERAAGMELQAEQRLEKLRNANPGEPQFALNLLDLRCAQGRATDADVALTAHALAHSRGIALDVNYHWLASTLLPGGGRSCSVLETSALASLLYAATQGAGQTIPDSAEMSSRAHHLTAHLALRKGQCKDALVAFNSRISVQPRPEFAHTQTGMLATRCGPQTALTHLEYYLHADVADAPASSPTLRLRDWLMRKHGYWHAEGDRLRTLLVDEIQSTGNSSSEGGRY